MGLTADERRRQLVGRCLNILSLHDTAYLANIPRQVLPSAAAMRPRHHHSGADNAHACAHKVVATGRNPSATTHHVSEAATRIPVYGVRGQNPTEVSVRLQGCDEAVAGEGEHPGRQEVAAAVLATPCQMSQTRRFPRAQPRGTKSIWTRG